MMTIFTRLFGRRDGGQQLGFIEAQRMVLDYARFLENSPPMPGRVMDTGRLPHNKADMEAALLMCISNNGDPWLEEHLVHGYLMLSAFQEDVGETLGTDFVHLDLEADPLETATAIELAEDALQPWQALVLDDLDRLQRDLQALQLQLAEPARLSA